MRSFLWNRGLGDSGAERGIGARRITGTAKDAQLSYDVACRVVLRMDSNVRLCALRAERKGS